MQKNKLFVICVLGMSSDLSKPEKFFYVYEMTSTGYLVQKHGSNFKGAPFKSQKDAQAWMDQRMQSETGLMPPSPLLDLRSKNLKKPRSKHLK